MALPSKANNTPLSLKEIGLTSYPSYPHIQLLFGVFFSRLIVSEQQLSQNHIEALVTAYPCFQYTTNMSNVKHGSIQPHTWIRAVLGMCLRQVGWTRWSSGSLERE